LGKFLVPAVLIFLVALAGGSIILADRVFSAPDTSPNFIGQTYDHGWWGGGCHMHDSPPVVNQANIAAQVRETDCSYDVTDGWYWFFVFLRPVKSENSSDNLVFRFQPIGDDYALDTKPRLSWVGGDTLVIVLPNSKYYINRQLKNSSRVSVVYRFKSVVSVEPDPR
jgi:hypothetical protein